MKRNIFNTVKMTKVDSNVFDLSYDMKMSLNMGELIPVNWMEIVPGDVIKQSSESLLRFAPLIAPIMHKVDVYTHSFFVPNRLLWPNWENFISGSQINGAPIPAAPYILNHTIAVGSLGDYLGLPTGIVDKYSALPFAAYQTICDQYYRDQNLQVPIDATLVDGDNEAKWGATLGQLRKRAWEHDYFTASLPFAQKGDAVDIPLGEVALKDDWFADLPPGARPTFVDSQNPPVPPTGDNEILQDSVSVPARIYNQGGTSDLAYDPANSLEVTPTTINNLRVAFRLQEWFEKNARAGTRYIENILSHFGVRSSDARLNRPEYLGGSMQPVIISEVLQTSESASSAQGNMAGHGVSVGGGKEFSYRAEEHGIVMTILSILPKTAYQQGISKSFSRFDRLDYYWPSFAHLGEQEVLNREVYFDDADGATNDLVFGYVPRYAEYRYMPSRVAGDFRDNLSYWHMGRIFPSRPALNADFIASDPTHRIFAVTDPDEDKIYAHVFHRIKAIRKMPKYGIPTF